jgi:hypothetical protein
MTYQPDLLSSLIVTFRWVAVAEVRLLHNYEAGPKAKAWNIWTAKRLSSHTTTGLMF